MVRRLHKEQMKVATAELGTGGMLKRRLLSGRAAAVYGFGIMANSLTGPGIRCWASPEKILEKIYGEYSPQAAAAMAIGAREAGEAHLGLAAVCAEGGGGEKSARHDLCGGFRWGKRSKLSKRAPPTIGKTRLSLRRATAAMALGQEYLLDGEELKKTRYPVASALAG